MRFEPRWSVILCLAFTCFTGCASTRYAASNATPPPVQREFRGAWIATVDNIDWPSKKDLSTAQQKAELLSLIERASALKLNAIVFQVRPQCDALYPSTLEPWSEFLTGQMGRAPNPAWDPLEFIIDECHKRGMELHAWFNPYRALHPAAKGPVSPRHVSRTEPSLVRSYGRYLWLDPGDPEVQQYSLRVVLDVLNRYDVDGIHFDDYFYPYKEKAGDTEVDFPDDASWRRFGENGKFSREDWRRENVNQFVAKVHQSIKASKPWVKFGISPFGIWRPGHPAQIKGYDAYDKLYADARKWLRDGSVDYFVPQLYWPIAPRDQSFPVLLDWWNDQNPKSRHIWPGLATYKGGENWKPDEIPNQIRLAAKSPVSAGHIHYSLKPLLRQSNLQETLRAGLYSQPALVPASPWMTAPKPPKPVIVATPASGDSVKFKWSAPELAVDLTWIVQSRNSTGDWKTEFTATTSKEFQSAPELLAVTAINRIGTAGVPAVLKKQ